MSKKTFETNFCWYAQRYDYIKRKTIDVYYNIDDYRALQYNSKERPSIGSCCGSSLWGNMEKYSPVGYRRNGIGIKIFEGKKIDPWVFDPKTKTSGHVVETKNGPLTITIREKW